MKRSFTMHAPVATLAAMSFAANDSLAPTAGKAIGMTRGRGNRKQSRGSTMRLIFICFLAVLGVCNNAWARPVLQLSPDTTAKEVLDACGADDPSMRADDCDRIFSELFEIAREAAASPVQDGAPPVCFPDAREVPESFRPRIVAWLREHPDVQSMPFMSDGSRLAVIGAYACK